MKQNSFSIMKGVRLLLQKLVINEFGERDDVTFTQSRSALILRVPTEQDAFLLKCTRVDDTTVSFAVYKESDQKVKLYLDHYNRSCEDVKVNANKLSKIANSILPILASEQPQTDTDGSDMENMVLITDVQTVRYTEHHVLSVSFDNNTSVNLSVPQEQLEMFSVGNMLLKTPYGLRLLGKNTNYH